MNLIDYNGPEDWNALGDFARETSAANPDSYVLVVALGFSGYALRLSKSLPRDARSRAANAGPLRGGYWKAGKRREFTTAQIVSDQQDWR